MPFRIASSRSSPDAVKVMTELAKQYPQEIVLLTLGPLTNLALACDRDADFLGRLRGVVCLAGTVTTAGPFTNTKEVMTSSKQNVFLQSSEVLR